MTLCDKVTEKGLQQGRRLSTFPVVQAVNLSNPVRKMANVPSCTTRQSSRDAKQFDSGPGVLETHDFSSSALFDAWFMWPAIPLKISAAFHFLDFDFSVPFPEEGCRSRTMSVKAVRDGILDAVMITWDLALCGDVTYSTR